MILKNIYKKKLDLDSSNPIFGDTLKYYFDLQCIPKRNFIKKMAELSLDEMEKARLHELSSSSGIVRI